MHVLSVLSAREGQPRILARAEVSEDGISIAAATRDARDTARIAVLTSGLPSGWSLVQDPASGAACWWHSETHQTVFTRPV